MPKQSDECVGTRPCRKTCPKKTRDCDETEVSGVSENHGPSLTEQRRMIDRFVDLGIARYLEKARRQTSGEAVINKSVKRDIPEDFKSLLRDWAMMGTDGKDKRTCQKETGKQRPAVSGDSHRQQVLGPKSLSQEQIAAGKRFTTPKPGSIVKDVVPANEIVLYEAPLRDELLKANVSDVAFQEGGDVIPIGIDTRQEKVYRGAQAAKMIAELAHHNTTKGNQDSEDGGGASTTTTTPTSASTATTLATGSTPEIGSRVSNKTTDTSGSVATPRA